ncbi:MAG: NAD(P)/FAD-dependent oxidoreductase [Sulfurospirillaceae bacterium]|nr:NAD(P)/FAD-dependent oxidoreductase [Sulfurospirillaceae bacterium]
MQNTQQTSAFDVIVIGAGASGMVASIILARQKYRVLLLEKLPQIGAKLNATGGGKCNLANTLSNEEFMGHFGREGRFMSEALNAFDASKLREFFQEIGVETHVPDGRRVFPKTHSSTTVVQALESEMKRLDITLLCSQKVEKLLYQDGCIKGVVANKKEFYAPYVILSTGGLGYSNLGAQGDGYALVLDLGHTIKKPYPAMLPLFTKETWVAQCRADTIPKATLHVDLPKYKKVRFCGDLIFTSKGIRGPVVLDSAREITPLLDSYESVPLLVNLTQGLNEEQIYQALKQAHLQNPQNAISLHVATVLPISVATALCLHVGIEPDARWAKLSGEQRSALVKILAWTPLHVSGHEGFKNAMITRGGISLKEICPKTMQSKLISGLFLCGEVVDLDGPCGGFNLQWAFSSGYIAGHLGKQINF